MQTIYPPKKKTQPKLGFGRGPAQKAVAIG